MASDRSTTAPETATQPNAGCKTNMNPRKTGIHGASRIGMTDGPDKNALISVRSRSFSGDFRPPRPSATVILIPSTTGLICSSSQLPTFCIARVRMISRAASASRATKAIRVNTTRVSVLRLTSTRSNTCIIYSEEVSIRILMQRLNATIAPKAPVQALRACSRTLSGFSSSIINKTRRDNGNAQPFSPPKRADSGGFVRWRPSIYRVY